MFPLAVAKLALLTRVVRVAIAEFVRTLLRLALLLAAPPKPLGTNFFRHGGPAAFARIALFIVSAGFTADLCVLADILRHAVMVRTAEHAFGARVVLTASASKGVDPLILGVLFVVWVADVVFTLVVALALLVGSLERLARVAVAVVIVIARGVQIRIVLVVVGAGTCVVDAGPALTGEIVVAIFPAHQFPRALTIFHVAIGMVVT